MRARLYQPARTAMSSGYARSKTWLLEYPQDSAREIDPLMGWTSSGDTQAQVRLWFDTKEEALAYARSKGVDPLVTDPQLRKPILRPGGYGENFATARKSPWTH